MAKASFGDLVRCLMQDSTVVLDPPTKSHLNNSMLQYQVCEPAKGTSPQHLQPTARS
jgi:hypothetical protein